MNRLKVVILALLTLRGLAQRILILILKKGIKMADLTEGQIAQCMKVARTIIKEVLAKDLPLYLGYAYIFDGMERYIRHG